MTKTSPPPATWYQLTKQIPSVFLEKDTVALIEAFLLERGYQVDPPRARGGKGAALFVSAIYSSRADRLASIKDYPFRTFEEGIESLFVGYGEFEQGLGISVNFARTAAESHVSVNYSGTAAGKIAEGLADGIIGILEEVKTSNALYHPDPGVRGALTALFLGAIGFELGFLYVFERVLEFLFPLILVLYGYLYLAPMFNPYTTFDTPRGRRFLHWSTWLVGAALTLLVFWFADSSIRLLFP